MSFSDHATSSFKNNRALLKTRKGPLQVLNDLSVWHKQPTYKYNEATPEMLEGIRQFKIQEEKQLALRKRQLLTVCTFGVVITLYFIYKSISL